MVKTVVSNLVSRKAANSVARRKANGTYGLLSQGRYSYFEWHVLGFW